jgi:hypothetical protein
MHESATWAGGCGTASELHILRLAGLAAVGRLRTSCDNLRTVRDQLGPSIMDSTAGLLIGDQLG